MGITLLLREISESSTVHFLGLFGFHILGILYFGIIHAKMFGKMRKNGRTAVILNFIGFGFGQAYNRQMKKAFLFFAVIIVTIVIGGLLNATEENWFIWLVIALFGITLLDAYRGSFTAHHRAFVDDRLKNVKERAKTLIQYRDNGHEFAVDTNILMHEPDLLVYLLENEAMELYMSMMVFNELDGLKKSSDTETRKRAQLAFDVIEEFQRENKLHLLKTPKTEEISQYGLSGSPDEKIIGTYLREIENGRDKLLFLSNDKGARILARNAGMPIAEV